MALPAPAAGEVRIPIDSEQAIVEARRRGRELADRAGFQSIDVAIIAAAISEIGRNCLAHATGGEIVIHLTHDPDRLGVVIVASDQGPGLAGSIGNDEAGSRSPGRPGMGMGGVSRLMDKFEVTSGVGSRVTATKWRD